MTVRLSLGNKVKNLASLPRLALEFQEDLGCRSVYTLNTQCNSYPRLSVFVRKRKIMVSWQTHARCCGSVFSERCRKYLGGARQAHPGAQYFAVRSAGAPVVNHAEIAEDSAGISLAGQYESFLLVPARNVPSRIVLLRFTFLVSDVCRFKVAEDAGYLWSRMSVLIQEMHSRTECGCYDSRPG